MSAKRLRFVSAAELSSRELLLYQRAVKPTPFGFPHIELCIDYTNIVWYRQHEILKNMQNKTNPRDPNPRWLTWAQKIQALAQSGLQYTENPFDVERYHQLSRIAAEMMSEGTGADLDSVRVVFEAQEGYATPKVDVRGAVFEDEKILLVRELQDNGRWTLPGGWVDVNEPPSLAVEREVREEAGFEVKAIKLLAVYDRNLHGHPPFPFHTYKLFFRCDLVSTAVASALETSDPTFFPLSELPDLSIARVTQGQIARMFEHLYNPTLQTDFD
jgi:ADP-ribose pyrophosphatase YjhB (NUDIX family)